MISLIVAMTPERVIGKDGGLPWHLPADLRHFRNVTMGHPVIMGRKTYESIGKPLERRLNIVLTRDPQFRALGCTVVRSPDEAIRRAVRTHDMSIDPKEIVVIGGASVYEAFLPRVRRMYITFVETHLEGEARFPEVDFGSWREVRRDEHRADDHNPYDHRFVVYERAPGRAA